MAGTIGWAVEGDVLVNLPIIRALLRQDELVIDCETPYKYTITLKRTASCSYQGEFDGHLGKDHWTVKATGALYSNENGYAIIGDWLEDTYEYKWWAELREVEDFTD